jgi:hypothetical protein
MNKWQIICPLAALLIFSLVAGVIVMRGQHRAVILSASSAIGTELLERTNSTRLVRLSPFLRTRLAQLYGSPTRVAGVLVGDAPPPDGDGTACSRVVLTNVAGGRLLIRLRTAGAKYEVAGFRDL